MLHYLFHSLANGRERWHWIQNRMNVGILLGLPLACFTAVLVFQPAVRIDDFNAVNHIRHGLLMRDGRSWHLRAGWPETHRKKKTPHDKTRAEVSSRVERLFIHGWLLLFCRDVAIR